MKSLRIFILSAVAIVASLGDLYGQHTVGITAGTGMSTARFYPTQEMRQMWGQLNGGISWRYYGEQRYVGGFGIDLEFVQQGFSFAANASVVEDKSEYLYYTRHINSIMMPIVWQPHIYLAKNKLRAFLDLSITFSYNLNSTYENELYKDSETTPWQGEYEMMTYRDNRLGYGLAGGVGIAYIMGRYEFQARARYYFGYADIVKNRNKYMGNYSSIYPFTTPPMRTPLDNVTISLGVSYRLGRNEGYTTWTKPRQKREKMDRTFNYDKNQNKIE